MRTILDIVVKMPKESAKWWRTNILYSYFVSQECGKHDNGTMIEVTIDKKTPDLRHANNTGTDGNGTQNKATTLLCNYHLNTTPTHAYLIDSCLPLLSR